ncbi:MAG: Lytic transglycosylase catalytic [Frankiales bacterium]|nr:Lytic transglycosylase catalytic [Frankiales bacterium]
MRHLPQRAALVLLGVSALVAGVGVTVAVVGVPTSHPSPQRLSLQPKDPPVAALSASRSRPLIRVARLKRLLVPDLLVTTRTPITAAQAAALRHIRGLSGSTVLGTGLLHVDSVPVHALAVDPSQFRSFTPRETAVSDALWSAIARGDLAPAYSAKLPLGRTVSVVGHVRGQGRIGAVAAYGIPGADLVVNRAVGAGYGLRDTAVLLAAPGRRIAGIERDVRAVLGASLNVSVLRPVPITYRRPTSYRELYMLSARYCPGLSWKVLAAIGQVESGHGRNVGPSSAGALGPMQFMPATWAFAGVDGDGDGKADIMSAYDAVPAAALYLCRNGAGRGGQSLYNAVFSYNHADWYVREVLALAARYA